MARTPEDDEILFATLSKKFAPTAADEQSERLSQERAQALEDSAARSRMFQGLLSAANAVGTVGGVTAKTDTSGLEASAKAKLDRAKGVISEGASEQERKQKERKDAIYAALAEKKLGSDAELQRARLDQDAEQKRLEREKDLAIAQMSRQSRGEKEESWKVAADLTDKDGNPLMVNARGDTKPIMGAVKPKKEGQQKSETETAYRYNSLKKNAEDLKRLVQENGTAAFTGPAGSQMDSKIYQMAVDYAKLVDPDSVAREGEVAAAQKYMLPFRQFGGLATKNSTALSQIDNYLSDLDQRLAAREQATGRAVAGIDKGGSEVGISDTAYASPSVKSVDEMTEEEIDAELRALGK
jgi:hypothetical protein